MKNMTGILQGLRIISTKIHFSAYFPIYFKAVSREASLSLRKTTHRTRFYPHLQKETPFPRIR